MSLVKCPNMSKCVNNYRCMKYRYGKYYEFAPSYLRRRGIKVAVNDPKTRVLRNK